MAATAPNADQSTTLQSQDQSSSSDAWGGGGRSSIPSSAGKRPLRVDSKESEASPVLPVQNASVSAASAQVMTTTPAPSNLRLPCRSSVAHE